MALARCPSWSGFGLRFRWWRDHAGQALRIARLGFFAQPLCLKALRGDLAALVGRLALLQLCTAAGIVHLLGLGTLVAGQV